MFLYAVSSFIFTCDVSSSGCKFNHPSPAAAVASPARAPAPAPAPNAASVASAAQAPPKSLFNPTAGQTRFDPAIPRDQFRNCLGQLYDLSPDGAFRGNRIAVYQAYTGENFTFNEPKAALEKKGFAVVLWREKLPPVDEFRKTLDTCCQLWLLSGA